MAHTLRVATLNAGSVLLASAVVGGLLGQLAACHTPDDWGPLTEPALLQFRPGHHFPHHQHHLPTGPTEFEWAYFHQGGGLAVGDVDSDGRPDLFASGGEFGHQLFLGVGGGDFVAVEGAIPRLPGFVSSATFADVDGDGDDDLLVSHLLAPRGLTLLRNTGGILSDDTERAGLGEFRPEAAWSVSFADIDTDGDLDFFVAQWLHWTTSSPRESPHVFCNSGSGTFVDCSARAGMTEHFAARVDSSFTTTFTDINEDGSLDLLVAADYGRSAAFLGDGAGRFAPWINSEQLSIHLGMGSAVGDFNGDTHMDWFVSAVFFPSESYESNGNRIMLGNGTGALLDTTWTAGISNGGWGWGVCTADFDLDGDEDIFHTSGYEARPPSPSVAFALTDPLRLFVNDGTAHFTERSLESGLSDDSITTSAVCADFDDDGDIDIVTLSVGGILRSYENALAANRHYISIDLEAPGPNPSAIGARVEVWTPLRRQVRERRIDNTHASGQSTRLHFGLLERPTQIIVSWPDGVVSTHRSVPTNAHSILRHP